ncbi:MAG TPA: PAS domain S-box protein, partial [Verrucomicrobiae bacterium]|nr:PAS domain S-box protein [Verrucomicrobiae bacterium]
DITDRKRAEEALRESEERFRLFFEEAHDAIVVTDADAVITFANVAAARLFGSDLACLPGSSLPRLCGGSGVFAHLREEGGVLEAEVEFRREDGTQVFCLMTASRLKGDRGIHAILHDITDRKRVESALGESEKKFRTLFNSTGDAIYIHDLAGRLLEVNEAACQRTGYTREELLSMTLHQLEHSSPYDDAQRTVPHTEAVYESWHACRDGSMVPVEVSRRVIGFQGGRAVMSMSRDISERKRAERQLRRLSYVVEQIPVSVVVLAPDGLIEYVNPRFTEISGYTATEAVGRSPRFLLDRGAASFYREMRSAAARGKTWRGEMRNLRKNGESYWAVGTLSPLRDAEGTCCSFVLLLEDITDRRKLEEQLRHSQKLDAVGQLAGGIAHDFNNILTAIIGYAGFLQMKAEHDPAILRGLGQIVASAERGGELSRGLLAFSRKQVSNPRPVELNRVVQASENLLRRLIGADLELRTAYSDANPVVMADSLQMEQVLMNLATNSRDAMPSGGVLRISTSTVMLDEAFVRENGFGTCGAYALLEVSDTGAGMDAATMKKMFEPFFTTKEVGSGTGLGLSILYGIVNQHGGYVSCDSAPGAGTTFRIYLPLCDQVAAEQVQPAQERVTRGRGETILVAEDSPVARAVAKDVLEDNGYTVLEAEDGEQAVNVFRERKREISLVLLDVIMPRKSGKQVYEEITAIDPEVRVVFTSAYPPEIVARKGVEGENARYVQKPVSSLALLARVREALDAG